MRYVRARRLTEAARALAAGAPDILHVALDAEYGSHEAFTRAFRDHFGVTPEAVRATTCLDTLKLQEPILMDSTAFDKHRAARVLKPARPCWSPASASASATTTAPAFPACGSASINMSQTFPGRIGQVAYGVCCNGDDAGNFDYIAGVEVADFSDLPREFSRVRIPEQRYAVFAHKDHISTIRRSVNTIWNHWLPASGYKVADAPNFERYDEKFDPVDRRWRVRDLGADQDIAFSSEVATGSRKENASNQKALQQRSLAAA